MTDTRFGGGRTDDEGRMPWLEPVEEEEEPKGGPPLGKMIGLLILALVILGAAVGGYSWWSGRGATEGHGELIPAPPGPYKVKPSEPGGMAIDGEGDTAFAASEGADPRGRIDMSAVPEDPVVAAGPKGAKAAPKAEAKPAGGGGSIQLGAFSSEAAATSAWKALAGRFRYLEPLTYSVVPVETGDRTLYRLRASGPDAASICGRLRIAGESCVSAN
jgi:hypothetical protein